MKILFIHTSYAERGGEDTVFLNELELLSEIAEVDTLTFTNSGSAFSILKNLALAPWNFESAYRLKKKIKTFKPDLIHIHNWHFAGSPALIYEAKKMGVPVVMTLHNYRLLCPSATLFSDGNIFTDSLKRKFPWKAVFKKVYRNSAILTFWLAFVIYIHKILGTWKKVDQYIALSDFGKELYLNSTLGLTEDQITTKGNFVSDNGYKTSQRESHFLFVGRLTKDKGIELLLKAFENTSYQLKIIGDGPLKETVTETCKRNSNIHYKGLRSHQEIISEMKGASALVFPSVWYEGMPMTILEAFSTATPVIGSNLGAMKNLITDGYNGLLFDINGTKDLILAIEKWCSLSASGKEEFSLNARRSYEMRFTPEKSLNTILSIYKKAINQSYSLNNCNTIRTLLAK